MTTPSRKCRNKSFCQQSCRLTSESALIRCKQDSLKYSPANHSSRSSDHRSQHLRCPFQNAVLWAASGLLSLSVLPTTAAAGSAMTFDADHPFPDQTVQWLIDASKNPSLASDNSVSLDTYEGLTLKKFRGVLKVSVMTTAPEASNNLLRINAQTNPNWRDAPSQSLRTSYSSRVDLVKNNRLEIIDGNYEFSYENGLIAADASHSVSGDQGIATGNLVIVSDAVLKGALIGADINWMRETSDNGVIIHSGSFSRNSTATSGIFGARIAGAKDQYAVGQNNFVLIKGGTFKNMKIAGIYAAKMKEISGNVVYIQNGLFVDTDIYGSTNGSGHHFGNGVYISGGTFQGKVNIYATQGTLNSSEDAGIGFVDINPSFDSQLDLSHVTFYGNDRTAGGTLIFHNPTSLTIGGANKFAKTIFNGLTWQTTTPAVILKGNAGFGEILINKEKGFLADESVKIEAGDAMTLIYRETYPLIETSFSFSSEPNKTIYTQAGIARDLTGHLELADSKHKINFVVDTVETSAEAILVGEHRAASTAFLAEGSDLALRALALPNNPESLYGFSPFATIAGATQKYSAADDLRLNGWHFAAGIHGATALAGSSTLSTAFYFETGNGNYRTRNGFNEVPFRGDGKLEYRGAGWAARWARPDASGATYLEGSLRVGELHTQIDNALRAADGVLYGYDSRSLYWGGHLGAGRLFERNAVTLDLYGRWYWLKLQGDSFAVAGDSFRMNSVESSRLRLGARVQEDPAGFYAGAAFEREFNGRAEMTAASLPVPTKSLRGNSFLAEVGWLWNAEAMPFTLDCRVEGWTGERSGVYGQIFGSYRF